MDWPTLQFTSDTLIALAAAAAGLWGAVTAHRAWQATQAAERPVIEVAINPLGEPHWWNVEISARNRAEYGIDGVSLDAIKPKGALLQVPKYASVFDASKYEIRSEALVDNANRSLPLRIALAPRGAKETMPNEPPEFEEDRKGAWLYLPTTKAQSVKLKLTLRTREHTPRDLTYPIKRRLGPSV